MSTLSNSRQNSQKYAHATDERVLHHNQVCLGRKFTSLSQDDDSASSSTHAVVEGQVASAQVGGHGSRVAQRVPRRLTVVRCDGGGRGGWVSQSAIYSTDQMGMGATLLVM